MVIGLDTYLKHFRAFADRYVLIGGAACDVWMEEAGLDFRLTKDLDIVLCIEALDREFVQAFWAFIRRGGYRQQHVSTGKKVFYRFAHPADPAYPSQLELFARTPDVLTLSADSHLTPIPVDEELSSLSAILLDTAYYQLIHDGKRIQDGLSIVGPEYLIPLKAYAWLRARELRAAGTPIQSGNINKHRSDVFRLYVLLSPATRITLPTPVRDDLRQFLQVVEEEQQVNLALLGIRSATLSAVCNDLRLIYGLIR